MKKTLLILVLGILVLLTGCNGAKENDFKDAMNNMNELENYTMKMTVDVPLFGTMISTFEYDDGATRETGFMTDTLEFELNGIKYELEEFNDEMYAVEVIEEPDDEAAMFEEDEAFDFEDFQLVDGYYELTEENDDFTELKIKIEDGYVIEMIFSAESDDMLVEATIEIYDIDLTVVEVPEYKFYSEFDLIQIWWTDNYMGDFTVTENGFSIEGWDDIEYINGNDYYTINSFYAYKFFPETNMIQKESETAVTLEDYFINDDSLLSEDRFTKLVEIYYLD